MTTDNVGQALERVKEHCEAIVRQDWKVTDDEIKLAEAILKMIIKK